MVINSFLCMVKNRSKQGRRLALNKSNLIDSKWTRDSSSEKHEHFTQKKGIKVCDHVTWVIFFFKEGKCLKSKIETKGNSFLRLMKPFMTKKVHLLNLSKWF